MREEKMVKKKGEKKRDKLNKNNAKMRYKQRRRPREHPRQGYYRNGRWIKGTTVNKGIHYPIKHKVIHHRASSITQQRKVEKKLLKDIRKEYKKPKLSEKSNEKEINMYIETYNAKSGNPIYMPYSLQKIPTQKAYDDLSPKQKKIIWRELGEETIMGKDASEIDIEFSKQYYSQLKYSFKKMRPDDLPASSWESGDETLKIFGKRKAIQDQRKIQDLEKKIKNEGYNEKYPVSIEYIPDQKKVVLSMGNHRLQAIRNMISRDELSKEYKIPTMFIIENPKLHWKIHRQLQKKKFQTQGKK